MTATAETFDLPVLPLRDVVVFPHMVIPLFVGRDKSIRALDMAMEADKRILLVAQKSADTDAPGAKDLHEIGTAVLLPHHELRRQPREARPPFRIKLGIGFRDLGERVRAEREQDLLRMRR